MKKLIVLQVCDLFLTFEFMYDFYFDNFGKCQKEVQLKMKKEKHKGQRS